VLCHIGIHGKTAAVLDEKVPPLFNKYPLSADSLPQASNPAGQTYQFNLTHSQIFPNTNRTITVYMPSAYKADKPACVYVGLDGLGFNVPTVFDNLIAKREMPITIGVGVSPGDVASSNPGGDPRFDRSFEFDSMDDRLARFLVEEVLPAVEQHPAPDGRAILLSKDPNDRAIGGASTGGIGAFTVAWERPDLFRRVFIAIGTFVGMRGGEQYYVLVRKTEPKPIRVFMQDGAHDEWGGGPEMGDWWMSNQTMNRALEFSGYDVQHVWGSGSHDGSQAAAIFPDAMRWLWKDWPAAVQAGKSQNPVLAAILQPGETWQIAANACPPSTHLGSNPQGNVFYRTSGASGVTQLPEDTNSSSCVSATDGSFAFGPDGAAYVALASGGIEVMPKPGSPKSVTTLVRELQVRDLTVRNDGDVYAISENSMGEDALWLISKGRKAKQDDGLKGASGIAPLPDGLWLFVARNHSRYGLSYRIQSDGTLDSKEPFYQFHVPMWADDSGATTVSMDRDGRAYVGTRMGIQVFDRNGRVTAILPLPEGQPASSLCFGGPNFDTLYVASGNKIFRRKLRVAGAPAWAAPIQLPKWGAG
jgi:enterochelin esterase-like enzyme